MYNIVFWPMQHFACSVHAVHLPWTVCTECAQGCMHQNTMFYMFLYLKFYFWILKPIFLKIWQSFWEIKIFFLPSVPTISFSVILHNLKFLAESTKHSFSKWLFLICFIPLWDWLLIEPKWIFSPPSTLSLRTLNSPDWTPNSQNWILLCPNLSIVVLQGVDFMVLFLYKILGKTEQG